MTECQGDCDGGNSTVQGTQLYMKFCQDNPCAIKTEKCSLQCSEDEARPRKSGEICYLSLSGSNASRIIILELTSCDNFISLSLLL